MNIHKASGANAGAVSGKAASAPPASTAQAAQTAAALKMPSAGPPPQTIKPVPVNSLPSLIAAAGLPADTFSASIISFARFFSLPIKPDLMASIRRQGLLSPEDAVKTREALSFAAAVAESKGVELRPKGLELFAEAINPDLQRRDSEERKREKRDRNQHEPEKTNPLSASGLKEIALGSAEKDPLLAILNRLPGKNGRRWVVFPFSFGESGRKYRVSLRILLETGNRTPDRAVCLAMDIAEGPDTDGGGGKNGENSDAKKAESAENAKNGRHWSFVLNPADGMAAGSAAKLTVYLQPELPPAAGESLSGELAQLMGLPPANVSVKGPAEFPCELSDENDLLRSINEAV